MVVRDDTVVAHFDANLLVVVEVNCGTEVPKTTNFTVERALLIGSLSPELPINYDKSKGIRLQLSLQMRWQIVMDPLITCTGASV